MTRNIENKLQRRKKLGNLRQLHNTQNLIDFASNDYLGLARSSHLAQSVLEGVGKHSSVLNGLGSTGSRLLTGNTIYAQDLERHIALFHGYEAGLLFGCGYMANVGLISAVADSEDIIFFDAAVHASTHDGIRLSRAAAFPFRHNDLAHLESRLKNGSASQDCFICIESIYSTDGSKALLPEICLLAKKYEAHLIVDEAHAVGVCGPSGRGLVAEHNLTSQVFAQVTTFGKAMGTYGAIVLGNNLLKQALINFARPYIYTTALPLHLLAAIKCSYDLLPQLDSDTAVMKNLIDITRHHVYPPAYSLKAPLSPHHAARLENISISTDSIIPPKTMRPLIIESAGGVFVPLRLNLLSIDLFKTWDCKWVVVSKHYLGSINHTLLTLDALQKRNIPVAGLIFNGELNSDSEAAILAISKLPVLGRLLPESNINPQTIQRYAKQWQPQLSLIL